MELLFGLGILAALVAWGVAGWWRYWRAVQAREVERRLYGAQAETLWRMLRTQAEWDAQRRRDEWAALVLSDVEKGWTE